jgi:hypothetical protein
MFEIFVQLTDLLGIVTFCGNQSVDLICNESISADLFAFVVASGPCFNSASNLFSSAIVAHHQVILSTLPSDL